MKFTTKQPRLSVPLRPMICSIASALSLFSLEAHAQFASTPLYLQNDSSSAGQLGVKHNIMLFIDDSGSMKWIPGEKRTPRYYGEKSRLAITKSVLNKVLDKYQDQFNWSLQTLHNNGRTDTADFKTPWKSMKNRVDGIEADNGTPTTRRYYEIVSGIVMPSVEYRCQKAFVVLMSDGDANLSQACGRYSSSRNRSFVYPAGYAYDDYFGRQHAGACRDIDGGSYDTFWDRNTGLSFFSRKLSSIDFKTSGLDKAGKSWQGDPKDPKTAKNPNGFRDQLVQTFTIGFGRDISSAGRNYLTNGASRDDYYFSAESEDDLYRAFDTITDSIKDESQNVVIETTGTTAPAVTNSGISGMAANVQLDTGSWSSRLQFYSINPSTGAVVDKTQFKSPLFSERKVLIHDGKNVHWANETNKYGSDAYFGLTKKANEWKGALIPWLARSAADSTIAGWYKEVSGYSQNYRIRETSPSDKRNMGDIVDSPVLTIGGASSDGLLNGRNEFMVTAANDGMVYLFQSRDETNPYSLKLNYIPAGMERGANYGGKNVAETLKDVAHEKYGSDTAHPHRYLVNGGIVVRRTAEDAEAGIKDRQSFLFGAMGQGGRGAYALNIGGKNRATGDSVGLNAVSTAWNTKVPLFETAKGENNTLNYTVGTPQIGRIALERNSDGTVKSGSRKIKTGNKTEEKVRYRNTRYAGFLANGYLMTKGGQTESALYIYDMLGQDADSGISEGTAAGTLIKKLIAGSTTQGLSAPTLVDADFDGIVDVAYAGDYAGNMYRFDLRGEDATKWSVKKIFSGSAGQPVTSAPAVSRYAANKYVVIFGTGSDVYQDDVGDKTRQAVYGIYDDLSLTGKEVTAATSGDLVEQTLSETIDASGKTLREITSDNQIGDKKGWMVKLGEKDGERVVVKPTMILRTAVISTRIYDQKVETSGGLGDPCSIDSHKTATSSSSWILALNAKTGGKLSKNDAYVNFLKAGKPALYYAGLKQEGITSFTYMDGSKTDDSPVTRDGDSGGSGTDQKYKAPNSEIPNNSCFSKKTVRVLLTNKNQSFGIGGRICGLRRLSWREVFDATKDR